MQVGEQMVPTVISGELSYKIKYSLSRCGANEKDNGMDKVREGEKASKIDSVLFENHGNNMFSCTVIRDGIGEVKTTWNGEEKMMLFKGELMQVDIN